MVCPLYSKASLIATFASVLQRVIEPGSEYRYQAAIYSASSLTFFLGPLLGMGVGAGLGGFLGGSLNGM